MVNGNCKIGGENAVNIQRNKEYIDNVNKTVNELREDIIDIVQRLRAVEVRILMVSSLGGTVGGIVAGVITALIVNRLTGG